MDLILKLIFQVIMLIVGFLFIYLPTYHEKKMVRELTQLGVNEELIAKAVKSVNTGNKLYRLSGYILLIAFVINLILLIIL